MQRINTNDATESGGKKQFTNGDPHAEEIIEATTISAEFLNSIQEEICSFIEGEDFVLDPKKSGQMREAHLWSVASKVNPVVKTLNHLIEKLGYQDEIIQLSEIK